MTTTQTPNPTRTTVDRYIEAIAGEGAAFSAAAERSDLDAVITACPGWVARDLVQHVGLVHLWAAANIAHPSDQWITVNGFDDLRDYWPEFTEHEPDDRQLVDWYRSSLHTLLEVLRSTHPDHRCLTFLPAPSPLVMWARRQASEIAIHRYDLEIAGGGRPTFSPEFAADMLDELVVAFATRMRPAAVDGHTTIEIVPDDAAERHVLEIGPSGIGSGPPGAAVDLTVRGSAADLYVLFWNRPPGPTIRFEGDGTAMEVWRRSCAIRWR